VTRWRLTLTLILLVSLGLPLAMPLLELLRHPETTEVWRDAPRLWELARNTLLLVAGVLSLALPTGIASAVLLYRSDLPGRGLLRFLTVVTLFVPLPLFASAWQAALGTGGWLLPLTAWTTPPNDPVSGSPIPWKPWAEGLPAAIWVHAVAALPWVVWIVGQGLRWVERELEEDALLVASPWRVLWTVTFPRCRAAILAAALWVALQTATEITVTDLMRVRTYAEEVYSRFVEGQQTLAAATAVSLPGMLICAVLVVFVARRWERTLPPLQGYTEPSCLFPLGRWRWPCLIVVLTIVAVLAGVPVASLVWKAGLTGSPRQWSAAALGHQLSLVPSVYGDLLLQSLGMALAVGVLAGAAGLVACWLSGEARWFHVLVLLLIAVAWATPGPVIGISLKETIKHLVDGEETLLQDAGITAKGPLLVGLYEGPSPLPAVWTFFIRFFPCAVSILWPVVRLVPVELRDAARVDGAGPWAELRHVIWPLTAGACVRAALAVGVLSLGELAASKLVETPGSSTFAHKVFDLMHYGVTSDVAALCLVLLVLVTLGAAAVAVTAQRSRSAHSP
jgi:iron(III) transport system permease protein